MRAKLPTGKGIWPAIWMLPTDEKYGSWAASGEIDIVELNGAKPNELLGTLHYGGKWPHNRSSGDKTKLASGTFADRFHTFGIEWREGEIRWTLDGKPWHPQRSVPRTVRPTISPAAQHRRGRPTRRCALRCDTVSSSDGGRLDPRLPTQVTSHLAKFGLQSTAAKW